MREFVINMQGGQEKIDAKYIEIDFEHNIVFFQEIPGGITNAFSPSYKDVGFVRLEQVESILSYCLVESIAEADVEEELED